MSVCLSLCVAVVAVQTERNAQLEVRGCTDVILPDRLDEGNVT